MLLAPARHFDFDGHTMRQAVRDGRVTIVSILSDELETQTLAFLPLSVLNHLTTSVIVIALISLSFLTDLIRGYVDARPVAGFCDPPDSRLAWDIRLQDADQPWQDRLLH